MLEKNTPLEKLIQALQTIPGVGERTAQRMAYHLLCHRDKANNIAQALHVASEQLNHCKMCNNFTLGDICHTCADTKRDASILCIVENPSDLNMIENSHGYHGLYYVLMGAIRPIDGIGPDDLNFSKLMKRIDHPELKEVIVATNFTPEGQTTAQHLFDILKTKVAKVSRIARGIPMGSELEYLDAHTVAWAFLDRKDV
ncbi:recombination mediator RecR [Basilea psittacipulmonis]|uniref:Recombination protein RecR n=1 Tax=Basilea psittacipulmonis DSM 24701 TaxID=1072685 RepID=A0A077DFV0_9BURK|nr:recombination mediator RecR [Basilea psittacipulmonis]AIL32237.1 recombination protein RecR [Basilea psittacipulmonis DSM 24701]